MLNKPPANQLSDDHPTLHSPPPPPKKAEKAISTLPLRKAYVVQFNPWTEIYFSYPFPRSSSGSLWSSGNWFGLVNQAKILPG